MVNRKNPPKPVPQPPSVSPAKGIELLGRQIAMGKKLLAEQYLDADSYGAWQNTAENFLIKAFGENSPNIEDFQGAGRIWSAPLNAPDQWWNQMRREGLQSKLVRLDSYLEILNAELELEESDIKPISATTTPIQSASRKVFVVHGRNEITRETCARLLEKLELEPIILHEKPNVGRTIIEKFHDYSDVGFAVILLTGDDRGGPKDADVTSLKLRARQNVIMELGFFIAKLGRPKVCALYEAGVELPSDYDGVLFVPLDSHGAWRFHLGQELKASGIDVDLNKIV